MKRLVVVGNGMAGVACLEQILKHAPRFEITVFGDETHLNYNRILLSSVLAGEKAADDITLNPLDWYRRHNIRLHVGSRITGVDPALKVVTTQDGTPTSFDTLLIATGSSAFMPPIDGIDKEGGRDRRRPARARGGARPAGAGVRRDGGPPDGHLDGAAARSGSELLPEVEDGSAWHDGAPEPLHQSDPRRRHGQRRRVRRRQP